VRKQDGPDGIPRSEGAVTRPDHELGSGLGDWLGHDSWQVVFEAAPNAMLVVGADGCIQQLNQQAEALFGYARGDLIGRQVEVLVPERFRSQHPDDRRNYFAQPATRAMGAGRDLFGLRRDGSEVPIEIGLNPIRAPGGTFVLAAIIDITQRKRSEHMLRASLAEKETLLREIHHRVKNNMQVVSSMLSLQASQVDEPRFREMFESCQERVRAMALIHEKLYGAGNLATIDFGDYMHDLARMLVSSYARDGVAIGLDVRTEPLALDLRIAVPLGLILNELVTNALKHAFPDRAGGNVHIALLRPSDAGCRLVVADDGIGLPAGFDLENARTLGLRMVRSLIHQVDGSLQVRSEAGSRFEISFDL